MTNQQQSNANRHNAKKSTGPRTVGGRMRASMNALKHGMAAEEVVIPGEDPAELRALHESFIAAWKPVGTIEAKLVWEITMADWRLRRARRIEARFVEVQTDKPNALTLVEMFFEQKDEWTSRPGFDAIKQLLRYEAAVERSYYRAFHTLERLQARRLGKEVSPPQVMHIHANE